MSVKKFTKNKKTTAKKEKKEIIPKVEKKLKTTAERNRELHNKKAKKDKDEGIIRLTVKQEMFCQAWIDFLGNQTQASLFAFDVKDKELLEIDKKDRTDEQKLLIKTVYVTASNIGSEYFRKPLVRERIDQIIDERGFNDKAVKREHFKLLTGSNEDGTRMRAISEYYKLKGKYQAEKTELGASPELVEALERMRKILPD